MSDLCKVRWWNLHSPFVYRDDNLRAMGFKSYRAYLKSELWLSIRARVVQEDTKCEVCGKRKATQVHHRAYDPATLKGENTNSLTPICGHCHSKASTQRIKFNHEKAHERLLLANRYVNKRARKAKRKREAWGIKPTEIDMTPRLVKKSR